MNYYNDNDPFCCAWIENLIRASLIPNGHVDCRPIQEINPDGLRRYTQCHFFCGIAGWPYALQLARWDATWPVWTGSCPCQPLSVAGLGKGEKDERHLWPAFANLIVQLRPPTVFGEQVASKDGREWLTGVRLDLEAMGYAFGAADLCAAGVGSPHIRQRLFWVAQSNGVRLQKHGLCDPGISVQASPDGGVADSDRQRRDGEPIRLCGREPRQAGVEAAWGRADGRVADSEDDNGRCGISGTQEGIGQDGIGRRGSPGGSLWDHAIWHQCADGRIRRIPGRVDHTASMGTGGNVYEAKPLGYGQNNRISEPTGGNDTTKIGFEIEPALFPLADGLPNRVGILRGAGNAIVPQVAAEFVMAVLAIGD